MANQIYGSEQYNLIEQHLLSYGHDFNKDAKFNIIETIEKDINIQSII